MPRKQTDNFQCYTTWLHGRVTRKKRIPGNLPRLSCTSGRWSAPFTMTTRRSQQWHQYPWTPLRPWPSQQPSSPQSKSKDNRQDALRSAPSEATKKRWQERGNKEEATKRNPSQCGSRAKKQQEAEDLSPWRRERRGVCSSSLTIGSSTPEKLHNTLFWPSLLSSKSFIIQVFYHPNPSSTKSDPLSLSTNLGFSIPILSSGWKVFSSIISTLRIFRLSSPSLSLVGRFFIDWSLVRFSSSVSHRVKRFFTSNTALWDSSTSLRD